MQALRFRMPWADSACSRALYSARPRPCRRYEKIKVRWQTPDFQTRIKTFTDFTAQIIQHEIDHLNGVLI